MRSLPYLILYYFERFSPNSEERFKHSYEKRLEVSNKYFFLEEKVFSSQVTFKKRFLFDVRETCPDFGKEKAIIKPEVSIEILPNLSSKNYLSK